MHAIFLLKKNIDLSPPSWHGVYPKNEDADADAKEHSIHSL
jgi:hypothetical protein